MIWILIATIFILGIIALVTWGNQSTKKTHANFAKCDVISAIENVMSEGDHDEWDSFIYWPINDPALEAVRTGCLEIAMQYQGEEKGKDIATEGEKQLILILDELKLGEPVAPKKPR